MYGTLKRGRGNHALLLGEEFLGRGVTSGKFSIYGDSIPYLVKEPSDTGVIGELYRVNEDTLSMLDRLEGHPTWYRREHLPITSLEPNGGTIMAQAYMMSEIPTGTEKIKSGEY